MAVLVALVLGAGGAGGVALAMRKSSPSPTAVVNAAPAATTSAGTAHFSATVTVPSQPDFSFTEAGDTDFRANSSEAHLTVLGITEDIRYVGGTAYFPAAGLPLPGGAHWVTLTPGDVGAAGSDSSTVSSGDPTQGLQFLKSLGAAPVALGSKVKVDGVATQQYQIVINLQALVDRIGKAENSISPTFAEGLKRLAQSSNLTHVPGSVWLDAAGRVRRLSFALTISIGGQTITEDETINFSNFGAPVHVEAPPASDTVPFSTWNKALQRLRGGATN